MIRRLAPLLPLPFLLAFSAWGSARLADHAGARLVSVLGTVSALIAHAELRNTEAELDESVEPAVPQTIPVAAAAPAKPLPAPSKKRLAAKPAAAAHGVFISADTVLKLANGGVAPRGVAVKADGKRPAGLRLANVGGLGVGLRDGDVLTRAVGQPALSKGAVVQAVLIARARRVPVLDGEFWRDGERWALRVEQPYPKAP